MITLWRRRQYDEEILNVSWNPAIGLIALAGRQAVQGSNVDTADDSSFDVDNFLDRVYAVATQV